VILLVLFRIFAAVSNPIPKANSFAIAVRSWLNQNRGMSDQFWDIGQVPLRNFDWLPFNPLWSPSLVFQYRTRGGTCCPGGILLRFGPYQIRARQATSPDGIQPSPPFHHCSNHNIDPHHSQITSRRMRDYLSQRHKPNSTSQRMERRVRHS
jgi:hypothetical protein